MASQNLNVGTAANANDGDTLRAAFINVRKMFHEIYGITTTYADDLDLSTGGETFAESVQDIIGGMVSGNTESNITVSYDDANNKLNFTVAADITDVNAGDGLSGVNESGGAATLSLDLDDLTAATVDVAADSIPIIDSSDSNATRKESIADVVSGIAGSGLTATSGVLSVNTIGTDDISNDAVTPSKLDQFDDSLTAATSGDILVSNGTDFIHATMSGDATIASGGALTIANDAVGYAKLDDEFTTSAAIAASAVDFSSAAIFTKTLSANTTLTFSNVSTGMVKTLVIDGDFTLTLPSGVKTLNGTYSGTATKNVIQIVSTNGSTEMFATISNYTA